MCIFQTFCIWFRFWAPHRFAQPFCFAVSLNTCVQFASTRWGEPDAMPLTPLCPAVVFLPKPACPCPQARTAPLVTLPRRCAAPCRRWSPRCSQRISYVAAARRLPKQTRLCRRRGGFSTRVLPSTRAQLLFPLKTFQTFSNWKPEKCTKSALIPIALLRTFSHF